MVETTTPIFEAMRRAHVALTQNLRKLEEAIRPGSELGMAELRRRLGSTYTHLWEHFRLEERDGFKDEMGQRAPRLAHVAQELLDEHRELRDTLDSLHGEAIVSAMLDEGLRRRITEWIAKMRRHEMRENDLIQDVYESDLGASD